MGRWVADLHSPIFVVEGDEVVIGKPK
jgi:hypothetical protein